MSAGAPVKSRTFTRGGRQGRGGPHRGVPPDREMQNNSHRVPENVPDLSERPADDLSAPQAIERDPVPRRGARPRPQGRPRNGDPRGGPGGGRARGRGARGAYRTLPGNGLYSEEMLTFFNGPPPVDDFRNSYGSGAYGYGQYPAHYGDVRMYGSGREAVDDRGGYRRQNRNRGQRGGGQKQYNSPRDQYRQSEGGVSENTEMQYNPDDYSMPPPNGREDYSGNSSNNVPYPNHGAQTSNGSYDRGPRNRKGEAYRDREQQTPEDRYDSSNYHQSQNNRPNDQQFRQSYDHRYNRQYDGDYDGDTRRSGRQRQYGGGEKQWAGNIPDSNRRQRGAGRNGADRQQVNRDKVSAAAQPARPEMDMGQREHMQEQLTCGKYECLVCVDVVRQEVAVWNCTGCFHLFHLGCVRRWAKSSRQESGGWRCPACQKVSSEPPTTYKCFCGKVRDPPWNRRDTPHSCGEVCGRSRATPGCTHRCTLLCHPGPCPPCTASVRRSCPCGKKTVDIKCDQAASLTCDDTCGRPLSCGSHSCALQCHVGDCPPCDVKLQLVCFCGKLRREETCSGDTSSAPFCCGEVCGRPLSCGAHNCDRLCHDGECGHCPLTAEKVTHCPCGSKLLSSLDAPARTLCTDPVPTCGSVCGRRLVCGPPGRPHTCRATCHVGPCPPCTRQTAVRCRCGYMDQDIPCADLTTRADDARCQKRCSKKRNCGRHKCGLECCILAEHVCANTCGRKLTCGVHTCEEPCHVGQCRPCLQASFEELYCECGASVLFPPVACGTPRPPCSQPCSRQHSCEHSVFHSCHSQTECPPCVQLMKKMCYGGHEERSNVPCHQTAVSCGRPCGVALSCGRHKCKEPCHAGACPEQSGCKQPCDVVRPDCGHACASPCHSGACPNTPCRTKVKVSCECGHRHLTVSCSDTGAYRALNTSLIAHKLSAIQSGGSVDVSDLITASKNLRNKTLQCNAECAVLERNRRLAEALQIRNPELGASSGPPNYPPSMLDVARKAKGLAEDVHKQLTELVQLAQTSRHKSRSVAFAPMNRDRRQFIHEYCEHFGCESESYDEEPKRNVVVTAFKDRCWLPTLSVLQVIEREAGPRKVAPAQLSAVKRDTNSSKATKLEPAKEEPAIDYFDFTG